MEFQENLQIPANWETVNSKFIHRFIPCFLVHRWINQVSKPPPHSQTPVWYYALHQPLTFMAPCYLRTKVLPCARTWRALQSRLGAQPSKHTSIWTYLCCCIVYYFLCGQITFVPHQQLVDVFTGITVYLLQPLFYIIERLLGDKRTVSEILHQKESSALFSNDWERMWSCVLIGVIHNHNRELNISATVFVCSAVFPIAPGQGSRHRVYRAPQPMLRALHNWSVLPHCTPTHYFSLLHILNSQQLLPSGILPPPRVAEIRQLKPEESQAFTRYPVLGANHCCRDAGTTFDSRSAELLCWADIQVSDWNQFFY